MNTDELYNLITLSPYEDYESIEAKEFEKKLFGFLSSFGKVECQVKVPDRYDGRPGKIDFVFHFNGEAIPIEVDRKIPRKKSIYKVKSYNPHSAFVITRSPFVIFKV